MAVAGEQILTRLGFEVDGISLKSSLEKAAAFGSALRRAFADASAAFVGVAKGEAEVAAQADALGVSVERFAEWRFIAEQTGASSDALGASLKAMLANNPGLSDAASNWSARAGRCGRRAMPSARRMRGVWASILPSSPCSRGTFPGCATCSGRSTPRRGRTPRKPPRTARASLTAWRGWRACATWAGEDGGAAAGHGPERHRGARGCVRGAFRRHPARAEPGRACLRRRPGHRRGARPARLVGRAARGPARDAGRGSRRRDRQGDRGLYSARGRGRGDHRARQPQGKRGRC